MSWTAETAEEDKGVFDGFMFDVLVFDIQFSWVEVNETSTGWTAASALGNSWTPEAAI